MHGDIKHTFGCSSPKIDKDTDERHLMVSLENHTLGPLLDRLQAQMIWSLSFDTLGTTSSGQGAHLRYLDGTQHTKAETSQRWH